jgi:hypothetical protein
MVTALPVTVDMLVNSSFNSAACNFPLVIEKFTAIPVAITLVSDVQPSNVRVKLVAGAILYAGIVVKLTHPLNVSDHEVTVDVSNRGGSTRLAQLLNVLVIDVVVEKLSPTISVSDAQSVNRSAVDALPDMLTKVIDGIEVHPLNVLNIEVADDKSMGGKVRRLLHPVNVSVSAATWLKFTPTMSCTVENP